MADEQEQTQWRHPIVAAAVNAFDRPLSEEEVVEIEAVNAEVEVWRLASDPTAKEG